MRVVLVIGLTVLCRLASANPSWDRVYEIEARGGDWVCPDPKMSLVVSKGRFTIPWFVTYNEKKRVDIGKISGTVRESGLVVDVKSTLIPALPEEVDADRRIVDRIVGDMKIRFAQRPDKLEVELNAGNCYVRWIAKYAGDLESKPRTEKVDKVDKLPPPAPLRGKGAATWNGTYKQRSSYRDDWRCMHADSVGKLVVTNGRFSIPWLLDGGGSSRVKVAQLDGVIAANGSVKLRMSPSVKELPPEISNGAPKGENTLAHLAKATPTVKFLAEKGGRLAEIKFGKCMTELAATDYKVPVVKSTPRAKSSPSKTPAPKRLENLDCDDFDEWSDDEDYEEGDKVLIEDVGPEHIYKCKSFPCSGKPTRGGNWVLVAECH